jgi:hypothetical protein
MVMMAVVRLTGSLRLLCALLNGGEVLLRGAEISGLKILTERLERLENGIGARACSRIRGRRCARGWAGGLSAIRQLLRERGEVRLGLRQVTGLKILAEFLKLGLDLLKAILGLLNDGILKNIAADDSRDRHLIPPDLRTFLLQVVVASVV